MGFSVSGTYALLFFGFLFAMGTLHASASNAVEEVRSAQQYQNDHLDAVQSTDIEVADVAVTDPGPCSVTVTANNTGDTDLAVGATDVFVDGVYEENVPSKASAGGNGDTDLWAPSETLSVDIGDQSTPPERVQIVAGAGVADAMEVSGLTC